MSDTPETAAIWRKTLDWCNSRNESHDQQHAELANLAERFERERADMLAALELQEFAELYWSNDCPNAEDHGSEMPELCEHCFPHFDKARVARINLIAKAKGEA